MSDTAGDLLDQVEDLLLNWQEAWEKGEPRTAEDLCNGHSELLPEVRRRIAALEAMHALLRLGPESLSDPHVPANAPAGATGPSVPHELPALPDYEVLGLIDEGGMGTVYRARQLRLQRPAAIKMIRAGRHARADQLARFRAEAEAVARLRHPNVIQIYEVGKWQGQPFFSMEYVAGGNLAQRLARGLLPPPVAAEIIRTLAEAIQHAHACGVVHRDLKPANVLLRPKSPGAAEGAGDGKAGDFAFEPTIGDFGLAKLLDEEGPTRTGTLLGTVQYAAPEQAEGRTRDVGPATDVYALGAILYEMLAGRPPFLGENVIEVLDQVRTADPLPPSRVRPQVPAELEVICLKCLAKEPRRRYATAADLAADLERYLRGEPIWARRTPAWHRAVKWARRQPVLAGLATLSVAALLALLGTWAGFTTELQRTAAQLALERDEANRQRGLAETRLLEATEQHNRADYLLTRCMAAIDEHALWTVRSRDAKQAEGQPGSIPFVVARLYAASSKVYREDTVLPPADRERFAEHYARKAVELLRRADDHGYFTLERNRQRLASDTDLSALRGRTDFNALLRKIGPE
jgi:tRNA A-37 threonylcarbamoyl transferase component Bud32